MKMNASQFKAEWVPAEDQAVLNSEEFQSWYDSAPAGTRGMNLNNNSQRHSVIVTFKASRVPSRGTPPPEKIEEAIAFATESAKTGMTESYRDFATDRKW